MPPRGGIAVLPRACDTDDHGWYLHIRTLSKLPKYIPRHNVKGGRPVRLLEDIYDYELPDWHMPRYYNEDRQARDTRLNKVRV